MKKNFRLQKILLFFETSFLVLIFRLGIFLLPFRFWVILLKSNGSVKEQKIEKKYHEIHWALNAVKRYFPYISNCWSLGAAGMQMLKKRGVKSELHFGVNYDIEKKMKAHAWLESDGKIITGRKNHKQFIKVMIIRWGEVVNDFPKQTIKNNQVDFWD